MPVVRLEEAKEPFIVALDVGTSSVRALLYDGNCNAVEPTTLFGRSQVGLQTDSSGMAVFEAEAVPNAIAEVLDSLLGKLGKFASKIRGVAIDTFVSNMIGLDANHQPLTPLYTYADTRCAADAKTLRARFDQSQVHDRNGCMIHSSYYPARLAWEKRQHGERFGRVRHWWNLGTFLAWVYHGSNTVSCSTASWTGLLNRRTLKWDEVWLKELGIETEQLPQVSDLAPGLRGLKEPWRSRWPALADASWFLSIGDGAAANIGSGSVDENHMALTIGTTAAMRVVPTQIPEKIPLGLWNYRVDGSRPLVGGALTEGGNVHEWLNKTLKLPDARECERLLLEASPVGHGLRMLPFFAGERAPGWRDDATATIAGLRIGTTPMDLLQAGLESVALRLGQIYRRLVPMAGPKHRILASGGFLQSPAWVRMIASVLGKPITACLEPEATSRGVALLALEAMGAFSGRTLPVPELGTTFEPDMQSNKVYQEALQAQEDLYQRILG